MADRSALTLGLDLGTSAIKAVVLDADGETLATGSAAFATTADLPGQAEQDPADWIAAVSRACAALDAHMPAAAGAWRSRVGAIGLAGQLPTLVCLAGGQPFGAAITWKDARADGWAAVAITGEDRRRLYERTGMPIDGRYLGPMYHHHRRSHGSEIDSVLSAKDYLGYVLTGRRLTDPSTAVGYAAFDLTRGSFCTDLCARWQLPAQALPAVRHAHALAGVLGGPGAAVLGLSPGLPVTVGAADSVAGGYALAGLDEGTVCITMGSSTIIVDAICERRLDPSARYLLTPHVLPGWYGREMDLLATGTGYAWLSGLFGWQAGELDEHAMRSPPGARGLTFTPYLAGGEQGALWDPTLTSSLRGLGLAHTPGDIARALLEGIAFEIRRCTEVLAETGATRRIVVSGHIVDRPTSVQMLADVLACPVVASRLGSPAAVGAALGARELAGLPAWARAAPQSGVTVRPGADSDLYQALYRRYVQATP